MVIWEMMRIVVDIYGEDAQGTKEAVAMLLEPLGRVRVVSIIVFHMGYNVFCDLVKHGRITAVSEETEKALEAMKDA